MFFRRYLTLVLVSLLTSSVYAQNFGTVKGVVKDSLGVGIDYVSVVVNEDQKYSTHTNPDGNFSLQVPADRKLTIVFSSLNIIPSRIKISLAKDEVKTLVVTTAQNTYEKGTVEISAQRKDDNVSTVEVKSLDFLSSVNESFESGLQFQGLGVMKNNDLSSNYSVRGGNFDENLVYVNDFEIYRPFLIRSGQQEGLSFIHPSMVSNVKFSSGGFQSRYGDKLSSVLDVTYKKPLRFGGSFYASLLGFGGHIEGSDKNGKVSFLVGVRQRLSQYILRSLEEEGQYSPNFIDVQGFFTFKLSKKLGLEVISNFSRNNYVFKPETRETTFGLLTDVKKLTIFFDGQEADRYESLMNGLSLVYSPNENLRIKWLASHYRNREKEAYDILGEYFLSQVESDLGKSNFGEVLYSLGIGGLQDWGRNTLSTDIIYGGHRGSWFSKKKNHNLLWGFDYKHEIIADRLNEWDRLDSAGYSLPNNYNIDINNPSPFTKQNVELSRVLKSSFNLNSNRISGFFQDTWKFGDTSQFSLNYGVRFQWWDVNKEIVVTPRVQFSYKPKIKADIVLTAAVGAYYQPPFYREMRNLSGQVNTNLRAQKSIHSVLGVNYAFKAWKRNFSLTSEVYYKHLWDLVPYEFDNVLIRYFGQNQAKGYSAGFDVRLNGELVEGAESWISMSVMKTAEDIIGDKYTEYYDTAGNAIANIAANADRIVDSNTIFPGYIPRPTDQRVNFALFFQDYIPKFKFIKVSVSLVFGTGLPFGPPDSDRYKDDLRIPPYRRVDIGFSGQLWNPIWAKKKNVFNQGLKSAWLTLDVFNIFGITNTVSYLWINDINNNRYAVPNYLTARRINAKLLINF